VDDPADNPAVVGTMSAGLVGRKQRRNHRPLVVIKPELLPWSNTPASAGNQSRMANLINNLIGIRP
jgi:hypothetical protein